MKYVSEFEGLRGLLALWVVVGHWSTTVLIPQAIAKTKLYNGSAVVVFVILSGFAIASLLDKYDEPYLRYLTRRALRIFPAYLFFLLLSAFAAPFAAAFWADAPDGFMKPDRIRIAQDSWDHFRLHLGTHLIAVHGLIPPKLLPSSDFALLGQAWSVSLEWQFYLIAPLFVGAARAPRVTAVALLLLVLAVVSLVIQDHMPVGFIGRNTHDFAIGIGSYYLLKANLKKSDETKVPLVSMAVFASIFLIIHLRTSSLPYLIWISVVLVIINARNKSSFAAIMLSNFLNLNQVQSLGRMAYSIYLSHMLVMISGLVLLDRLYVTAPFTHAIALLLMTVVGTLVVSTLTYRFIEKPFHELGQSLGAKRTQM